MESGIVGLGILIESVICGIVHLGIGWCHYEIGSSVMSGCCDVRVTSGYRQRDGLAWVATAMGAGRDDGA